MCQWRCQWERWVNSLGCRATANLLNSRSRSRSIIVCRIETFVEEGRSMVCVRFCCGVAGVL